MTNPHIAPGWRVDWPAVPALLARAVPFALIGVAGAAYVRLDALVLAALRPRADVIIRGVR